MLSRPEYRRLFALEIAISAIFSLAFAALFIWLLFGFAPIATLLDRDRLAFDFLPQTFMTVLLSYAFSGVSVRLQMRKRRFEKIPRRFFGALNLVPFAGQAVLIAMSATLTIGLAAMLSTPLLVELPAPIARIMAMKIAYGSILSAAVTILGLFIALSSRADRVRGVRPT